MKKILNSYRTMVLALATLFIAGSSFTTGNGNGAELKYIGSTTKFSVFQLELTSDEHNEYSITIKDADKKVLLSERLKGQNISRRYKLDIEAMEMEGTTFEVTNRKTNKTVVYKIRSSVSTVQHVSVAAL